MVLGRVQRLPVHNGEQRPVGLLICLHGDTVASASLDMLEDTTEALLWQWELRDSKVLPKALRAEAMQVKKYLHKVRQESTCRPCCNAPRARQLSLLTDYLPLQS